MKLLMLSAIMLFSELWTTIMGTTTTQSRRKKRNSFGKERLPTYASKTWSHKSKGIFHLKILYQLKFSKKSKAGARKPPSSKRHQLS